MSTQLRDATPSSPITHFQESSAAHQPPLRCTRNSVRAALRMEGSDTTAPRSASNITPEGSVPSSAVEFARHRIVAGVNACYPGSRKEEERRLAETGQVKKSSWRSPTTCAPLPRKNWDGSDTEINLLAMEIGRMESAACFKIANFKVCNNDRDYVEARTNRNPNLLGWRGRCA